ncbi:MAG: type III PLP-dependent enzyme [Leptospiraceae bacterium]|nr:type III PLP-dependent enzyme [Leptospiraceae bacterium]MDW8305989.1 type III PLP-dependent enzyme [Leptospiraceae bacterium]
MKEVSQKYKTPVLFIDKKKLRDNYRALREAFPDFRICYAIKSNSDPGIIEILRQEGSHFETASLGEILFLRSLGIPGEHIIYSNPVKSAESIARAIEENITEIAFDSLEELEKFLPYREKAKLIFRIAVPNEGSLWPLSGKFGAPEYLWDDIFEYMKNEGLHLYGVTFHPGSQAELLTAWDAAMRVAWRCIDEARDYYGLNPTCLNIGGGFPVYLGREIPSVHQIAEVVYDHLRYWKDHEGYEVQELICEPGRFLSGSAGYLVCKVVGVARREKNWVFLDSGVFSGLMETIDGITYPFETTSTGNKERVIFCGPSCDSVDKMFEVDLPHPKTGDKICFSGAGAYTTVYASHFNGFEPPQIVYLEEVKSPHELLELVG